MKNLENSKKILLREYTSETLKILLKEENGFGFEGGFGGFGFGWPEPKGGFLLRIVQPFTDIAKTAIAAVTDLTNRLWGLVRITVRAILNIIIPFAEKDYADIEKRTFERTKEIKQKYADVFSRTEEALLNKDLLVASFMLDPSSYLIALVSDGLLEQAKNLYNMFLKENKSNLKMLINEKVDIKKTTDAIKHSSLAKSMKKDAVSLFKQRFDDITNKIHSIEKINSLEELQNKIGKNIKLEVIKKNISDVQERNKVSEELLNLAKKEYKKLFLNVLKKEKPFIMYATKRNSEIELLYDNAIKMLEK